jgi:hypothetical protein
MIIIIIVMVMKFVRHDMDIIPSLSFLFYKSYISNPDPRSRTRTRTQTRTRTLALTRDP